MDLGNIILFSRKKRYPIRSVLTKGKTGYSQTRPENETDGRQGITHLKSAENAREACNFWGSQRESAQLFR